MKRITVLMADDNKVVRREFKKIIEFEDDLEIVGEAKDGHQAVLMVKKLRPTLVLMDVSMPLLNGLQRQNLLERCAAGIKSAKNRGVVFGRPKKLHFRRDEVLELKQQGVSIRGIARELRMPPASVHKIIKSTAKE